MTKKRTGSNSGGRRVVVQQNSPQPTHPSSGEAGDAGFRVVGIGASAGGLDALKEFFAAMPADSGMAFVVVQHLEPTHESRMAEILGKSTTMKVVQAEDGVAVEGDTVYTNPPGRALSIHGGRLVLGKPTEGGHVEAAIDHFLTSLAEDKESQAICIILSGSSGMDGPRGARAVRAAGGMCMAQRPGHRSVPRHAAGGHQYRPGGLRPWARPNAGGVA